MGYRYIGAKSRLLGQILPVIHDLVGDNAHVADLMCGTSAVSTALRQAGYQVTANDLMTYSYHHARVSLLFTAVPEFRGIADFIDAFLPKFADAMFPLSPYERALKALESVPGEKGYFWREFSAEGRPRNADAPRNYFVPDNARRIDGMRKWVRQLHCSGRLNDLEHSLLLHDLIMGANDVANIAGTYGHYMAHIAGRAKDPIRLTPTQLVILNDPGKHRVMQGYAEDIAGQIECDLCYIDPPYMKRQYAANYHILETLAREDEPEAIGVSGLRPWRDQYSNFCTRTRIQESFRRIFSQMQCDHFLVSYSEDGLLSLDEIQDLFGKFGPVEVRTLSNKRFKSNNSDLAPSITEYLIHLKKA